MTRTICVRFEAAASPPWIAFCGPNVSAQGFSREDAIRRCTAEALYDIADKYVDGDLTEPEGIGWDVIDDHGRAA
jgi:hypothetical protein